MRIAITIKQTFRSDGLGRPVHGWYICDYGVPIGNAWGSEAEAKASALQYARDLTMLNRQVSQ